MVKKFLTAGLILVISLFLFIHQKEVSAAPPAEQYRFQDNQTILGNGGDLVVSIVFERTTLVGEAEFNPGSTYTTKTNPRHKNGCFLELLKIDSFNSDGTQGILRRQPVTQLPNNIKFCDKKIHDSFFDKTIQIDNSGIRVLVDKNINITVRLKTNATKPEQIPNEYREDDITVEGPSGPNSAVKGAKPAASINSGFITFNLPFLDNEAGAYKACSKLAKKCQDFNKDPANRADITIQSDELIEGLRTGSGLQGDKCASTLDCANPLNCTNNVCGGSEEVPAPPPAPGPCAGALDARGHCNEFRSALGPLSTDPAGFIRSLFGIILSISGAIAILLIIRAGYKIMSSEGKPEGVQEGRERLISAVVGLLFIIFSLVFLQVIGFDILRIPGITGPGSIQAGGQCDAGGNNICAPGLTCESGICVDRFSLPRVSPDPQAGCTERVLKPGNSGPCVERLQRILGVSPTDGIYNSDTEEAVRRKQAEKGVFVDGVVGPCTWGAIMEEPIDPVCSQPLTTERIRQFQTEKGLKVDGTINKCTFNALMGTPIPDSCKRK